MATRTYLNALAAHNAAFAAYKITRDAYRAQTIGDDEFLAARRAFNQASAEFDRAMAAEVARCAKAVDTALNDFNYVGSVHHY